MPTPRLGGPIRFTGINSGWDTEAIVGNLMKAENMRLAKMQKDMMLATYRQEQYRNIYAELKTFQSTFLDIMKGGSLRSAATFGNEVSIRSRDGKDSGALSANGVKPGSDYTVKIKQLAQADLYESTGKIGGSIRSKNGFKFDVSAIRAGASYEFSLDGASRKITFNVGDVVEGGRLTFSGGKISVQAVDGTVTALDEQGFIDVFNQKLQSAFGMDGETERQKIEAKLTDGGGIAFVSNGYHTGFSLSDGNYSFASKTGEAASLDSQANLTFSVSIGAQTANLNVSTVGKSHQEIIDAINDQLQSQGLSDRVSVDLSDGKVKVTNFSTTDHLEMSGDTQSLAAMGFSEKVTIVAGGGLTDLGVTSGAAAKFNINGKLGDIFGDSLTNERSFVINGTVFNFSASTKIQDVIDGVNKANVGARLSYDPYSETFKLESTKTGYVNKIEMSGALLTNNMGFGATAKRAAADSIATINGTTLTRSSNEYAFEGVEWKLNQTTGDDELTVKGTQDADKIVEAIKTFVEGYNGLVAKLREQTNTQRPRSQGAYFDPLTDEERAEMKESEIKLWDENAKKGLLYNDSLLEGIESQLRSALNGYVTMEDGSKLSLYNLGIKATLDWTKGGALEIDEDKLREAIGKYGDSISTLFTKASEQGGKGLMERVNDVVNNALSTKGPIAQKAGIVGTYTETDNEIFRQLKSKNAAIEKMVEKLAAKEEKYYMMYSRMEAAMAKANSQMSYIQAMFGGG